MPHPNAINPKTGKRYSYVPPEKRGREEELRAAEELKAINEQIALLERQQKVLEARENLLTFTQFTMPDPEDPRDINRSTYKPARFHRKVAEALGAVERGEIQQLIFCMPPRHGKSALATKSLAAWYMGKHPDQNVAVAAYSDTLATEFGGDVRAIMNTPQFKQVFPTFKLRRGGNAKDNLETDKGGRAIFVGRGGALTGRGAHLLLIDDLYKDHEEARSQAIRDQAWNWFTKVAMTRRMGKRLVIITMCLTGDTPVAMGDGTWKRLEDVSAGDEVLSWSNGRSVRREVKKASAQGEDDVFEVRTRGGSVKGNARHPFLVRRGTTTEWVRLGDLRVGDEIAVLGRVEFDNPAALTADEAWALGFMFGDGWVTRNAKRHKLKNGGRGSVTHSWVTCVAACPKYPDRVARAIKTLSDKFGAVFKETKFGYFRTEKAALGRWLYDLGLSAGAKGKRAPEFMFSQPSSVREAFLSGFMAADGHVREIRGDQAHPRANGGYAVTQTLLANEALVNDLRHLARQLGYPVTNVCASSTTGMPPHSREVKTWSNYGFSFHHERQDDAAFRFSSVRSIEPAGRAVVYDLTIDDTENFIADGMVVHNTRWHSDDIIGRLTDPENPCYNEIEAKKWKIIRLPAVAEDDDPLGRQPGEALWPERYDLDFLQSQQRLDPMGFAALYQQRPTVADGVLFRRETIQYYRRDQLPEELRIYAASDHAVGTKQRNDPSCFIVVGVDRQSNIYVLDCWWERKPSDVAVEAMLTMARIHKPILWWAERGHISKSIGPFLKTRMNETSNWLNVREVTPVADKAQRAQSIAARVAMGKVYFPRDAFWTEKAVNEMMAFPNGLHDDFVDCLAYVGLGLQSQVPASGPSKKAEVPKFGTLGWVKWTEKWSEQQRAAKAAGGF